MKIKLLEILNIAMGIGFAWFIYEIFPYADGVAADAATKSGTEHMPLSDLKLFFTSAIPILIVGFITFVGHKLYKNNPRMSYIVLSTIPIGVIVGFFWIRLVE